MKITVTLSMLLLLVAITTTMMTASVHAFAPTTRPFLSRAVVVSKTTSAIFLSDDFVQETAEGTLLNNAVLL
jgi:hypothetical protein